MDYYDEPKQIYLKTDPPLNHCWHIFLFCSVKPASAHPAAICKGGILTFCRSCFGFFFLFFFFAVWRQLQPSPGTEYKGALWHTTVQGLLSGFCLFICLLQHEVSTIYPGALCRGSFLHAVGLRLYK